MESMATALIDACWNRAPDAERLKFGQHTLSGIRTWSDFLEAQPNNDTLLQHVLSVHTGYTGRPRTGNSKHPFQIWRGDLPRQPSTNRPTSIVSPTEAYEPGAKRSPASRSSSSLSNTAFSSTLNATPKWQIELPGVCSSHRSSFAQPASVPNARPRGSKAKSRRRHAVSVPRTFCQHRRAYKTARRANPPAAYLGTRWCRAPLSGRKFSVATHQRLESSLSFQSGFRGAYIEYILVPNDWHRSHVCLVLCCLASHGTVLDGELEFISEVAPFVQGELLPSRFSGVETS
jgi:hypothetical protein